MNATQFLELIKRIAPLEKADYIQLKKIQENFPYFHLAHGLAAKYEFTKNEGKPGQSLALAALTSPDRIRLRQWMEQPKEDSLSGSEKVDLLPEEDFLEQNPQNRTASLKKLGEQLKGLTPIEKEPNIPKQIKRKPPQDDLIETIKRKEKREIVDSKKREQIDLIKAFSKKDIKLATIKEIEANQNTENLADSSTKLNDNLVSETFAKILIKQGKKEMAKEIYEKLALKFPDKRTYFADLIQKLKE
ncbi:MAG: hypothetical protein MUE75_01385 [Algoriphagus sp.]|nr:hypothetical protein [Algoriphagus sp.]